MGYDRLVGSRNARATALLECNASVRSFIQDLCVKLDEHGRNRGVPFERLILEEPVIVGYTGDEYIRANILRRL